MAAADLADPATVGEAETRLPNTWIEPDIADELLRRRKMADVADCREEPCRHGDVYSSDRQEPLDSRINESAFRHLAIKQFEILAKPVEFAEMPLDRHARSDALAPRSARRLTAICSIARELSRSNHHLRNRWRLQAASLRGQGLNDELEHRSSHHKGIFFEVY